MISLRLFVLLSILIPPQSLFSQQSNLINSISFNSDSYPDLKFPLTSRKIDDSLKYNHIFLDVFTDTMSVNTPGLNTVQINSVCPRWIRGAIIPGSTGINRNHYLVARISLFIK